MDTIEARTLLPTHIHSRNVKLHDWIRKHSSAQSIEEGLRARNVLASKPKNHYGVTNDEPKAELSRFSIRRVEIVVFDWSLELL